MIVGLNGEERPPVSRFLKNQDHHRPKLEVSLGAAFDDVDGPSSAGRAAREVELITKGRCDSGEEDDRCFVGRALIVRLLARATLRDGSDK